MNTKRNSRRRPRLLLLVTMAALALALLFGPAVGTAQAQADSCSIEQFILADGTTVDLTAYAACVAAQGATQGSALPRTGASNVGQYVGIGLGLVGLGAAFVWGSRRRELATS